MKTKIIFLIPLLWISIAAYGQTYRAQVDFYIKNAGAVVDGTLQGFDGDIRFDPNDPGNSSISASVKSETIETGINMRDRHLQARGYFWADKYPEITMTSTKIEKLEEGKYSGTFDLSIKGITKSVEVPFSYTRLGNTEQFIGSFRIDRMDFKVGNRSLTISRDVDIEIELRVSP